MSIPSFHYKDLFILGKDETEYYLLSSKYVSTTSFEGRKILKVEPEGLTLLAQTALRDCNFFMRTKHQQQVASILNDPEASDNDKYVALILLRNSEIAAKGILPICQDTGVAIINAKKGDCVWTGGGDREALMKGIYNTYTTESFRYSINAPITMYEEKNTNTNIPGQIEIEATEGDEYSFLFIAKGGGSANKTCLYKESKVILTKPHLEKFLVDHISKIGTAACPPYHIAIAVGGTSAEYNLKTAKLLSAGYYDSLPTSGDESGRAFRDIQLEESILNLTRKINYGAQFGGKYFCHDIRIVRLPRHGASCFIGIEVGCSTHRCIKAKINSNGIWVEKLEENPARFIPEKWRNEGEGTGVTIDLNRPMKEILADLSKYPLLTRLFLTGTIIVARDIAHAKLKERLDSGQDLPQYFKDHPIYYAGPAKTPPGMNSGSTGPTTALRMDEYVEEFQQHGSSLLMISKGNRHRCVAESCKKHGGFFLGTIGGAAAILAEQNIKHIECLEYPELGMEAIWKIEVEDLPAFILIDDKGNDFYNSSK